MNGGDGPGRLGVTVSAEEGMVGRKFWLHCEKASSLLGAAICSYVILEMRFIKQRMGNVK